MIACLREIVVDLGEPDVACCDLRDGHAGNHYCRRLQVAWDEDGYRYRTEENQ